ncbi:MAG TPA: ORF6N domain-containing protein [Elusimicrobiales bacterium]|nr:ORF6N domain-containing protein [Elusimicrobiales bacterium]
MPEELFPKDALESKIYFIRGRKVILDYVLAALYGVSTKRLNEQVRRNKERFPPDFMFQLSAAEAGGLRPQFATSKNRGGRRYLPYAFTEYGAIQAANVVRSDIAIKAGITVVRAFARLREMAYASKELAQRIDELDRRLGRHDEEIRAIVEVIKDLVSEPEKRRRRIGFTP